jgi:hypothetical protein
MINMTHVSFDRHTEAAFSFAWLVGRVSVYIIIGTVQNDGFKAATPRFAT